MDKTKLKHLVAMLRITHEANEKTSKIFANSDYTKGINSGMKIANDPYLNYIERLETLVDEMHVSEVAGD